MNSLTKQGKVIVCGGLALIFIVAIGIYWWQRGDARLVQPASDQQDIIKNRATNALKSVADIANELSGITSGAVFNFEIIDVDGRSANFGIYKTDNGERLTEEHFVKFQSGSDYSEVDGETGTVIAMHRPVPDFVTGNTLPVDELELRARQFVERVDLNFKERFEYALEFDPSSKTVPGTPANYFFRWNDKNYRKTLPAGVEVDLDPFIQVGINANGFIFSYDNTIPLYWSCKVWKSPLCVPTQ